MAGHRLRVKVTLAPTRWRRLAPVGLSTSPREVLALAALASLFVASARYPVVADIGSVEIRLQDMLFGALVFASARSLPLWAARRPALATALGLFLMCLAVAAVRSPVGGSAVVAVAKYTEFVLAGVAIGLVLWDYRRPEVVTALLVLGTGFTAVAAGVDLAAADGVRAMATGRSGGLLSMEGATAMGAVTAVWCAVRLTRVAGPVERWIAVLGLLSAAAVLLLAKSVLALGAGIALAGLAPVLRTRWFWRAALALGLVLVVAAIGRISDIKSATGFDPVTRSTNPTVVVPPAGTRPSLPLPFTREEPERVTGGSFVHRVALAYLGLRIASEAPALGHGWLATSDESFLRSGPYDVYMLERFPHLDPVLLVSSYPTHAHNAYIQTFSEAGPFAAVLLLAVLLLAIVPAVVLVRQQHAVTPWRTACGLGWVIVMSVFLASSALFGGQSETCLLGASLALCAGSAANRPGSRAWALGVGVTLALAAAFVAVLALPRGTGDTPPVTRVALVDRSGSEVFRPGTELAGPSAGRMANGLVTARVAGAQVVLRTAGVADGVDLGERPVVRIPMLATARRAVVAERSAEAIRVDLLDASDRPVVRLTMARGVPGLYATVGGRASIVLPESRGVALGPKLGYAQTSTTRVGNRTVAAQTPVVVTGAADVRVVVPLNSGRVSGSRGEVRLHGTSRGMSAFLGLHTLDRSAGRVPPGAYAVRASPSAGPMRIYRVGRGPAPAWVERAAMVAPYVHDDAQRSGVARSISVGMLHRAAALR